MAYVDFLHAQKEMFADFVKSIVEPTTEKAKPQPTAMDIRSAIFRFSGRLVTSQALNGETEGEGWCTFTAYPRIHSLNA